MKSGGGGGRGEIGRSAITTAAIISTILPGLSAVPPRVEGNGRFVNGAESAESLPFN